MAFEPSEYSKIEMVGETLEIDIEGPDEEDIVISTLNKEYDEVISRYGFPKIEEVIGDYVEITGSGYRMGDELEFLSRIMFGEGEYMSVEETNSEYMEELLEDIDGEKAVKVAIAYSNNVSVLLEGSRGESSATSSIDEVWNESEEEDGRSVPEGQEEIENNVKGILDEESDF